MTIQHAESGEIISLPLGASPASSKTTALVKTTDLKVIRHVLPAGKVMPSHKTSGEITVQC